MQKSGILPFLLLVLILAGCNLPVAPTGTPLPIRTSTPTKTQTLTPTATHLFPVPLHRGASPGSAGLG